MASGQRGAPEPETVPEPRAAIEPAAPAPEFEPGAVEMLASAEELAPPLPLPDLELERPMEAGLSEAPTDPAIELRAFAEASSPLGEPEMALPTTTLPDLEAQGGLGELEAAGAGVEEPGAQRVLEPLPLPPEEAWTGVEAPPEETGAAPLDALAPVEQAPLEPAPPEPPRRPSLAERIDAAVEATEETRPADGDALAWGAAPEPLVAEDLGATPLDVADLAGEFSPPEDGAPIELSSADVVLLESEPAAELELGGAPADPVPLAGLHEFIGQQPADPRALAFEDQGEAPTFAPEELQATGAELAAEPQTFHAAPLEVPPESEPEPPPPPAPAAPRIVVPRPPPGPPPSRPAPAAAPQPRVAPVPPRPTVPPPASAVASAATPPPAPARPQAPEAGTSPARRSGLPPPPPAAAYVLGDDGRRLPAIAAAVPEPPQLAHQFGRSGPFGRPQALLLTPAPLDVMDGADELPSEPTPMPATDVATGAEVFGGTYLSPTFVEGEHRVVLHTLEGQVRRGTVKDLDLLDPVIRLAQPGRPPEAIAAERVKAIFFMQEPGSAPLPSVGQRIRVGFADGRQIVGFSEDVEAGEQGFFLVPADTRTHTARIYVFRAGVASISAA
ncbi:MAG TPA: hypothetical protein VLT82_22525 [Myxococcaceae bacterium]|nr:hypothetical protein [Myxococcaceae bacterium]